MEAPVSQLVTSVTRDSSTPVRPDVPAEVYRTDRPEGFSIALVMPETSRREKFLGSLKNSCIATARVFERYPGSGEIDDLLSLECDAVVIDMDADAEKALELAADIGSHRDSHPVMACSSRTDADLLMRVMQTGVREFLNAPLSEVSLREALERTRGRRNPRNRRSEAKVLVFAGTKGGAGVSTIASNFAVALRKESCSKVVIVDLDVQLGDVALSLGVSPPFSVIDALRNPERVDADFLSRLVVNHSSGLDVLSAPEGYAPFRAAEGASEKLQRVLRRNYNYVVVDAGCASGELFDVMLAAADTLYIVVEMRITSLRNARRMMSWVSRIDRGPRVEVILNRFDSREIDIREENAIRALARPADWKIPNDYDGVRNSQNRGVPLALEDSPVAHVLTNMAKAACGKPAQIQAKRRKVFGIF
jgi:pilus assembly protein CpaE